MAYNAYDPAKPNTSQTGNTAIDSARYNMQALRDAIVGAGMVQGFDYSPTGSASQPSTVTFKRSAEWVKANLTWGTSGGGNGCVTKAAFYYSSNTGTSYDAMADAAGKFVLDITYDSNGDVTATTWGTST